MPTLARRRASLVALAFCTCLSIAGASAVAQMSADQLMGEAAGLSGGTTTSMTVLTGLTQLNYNGDDTTFWRVALRPNLGFGRLRVGVDAVLLIGEPNDSDSIKVRTTDGEKWDTVGAFLRAVRYVQWATPRAPFYGRYGDLFNVGLGNGLLMEGYSNLDRRGLRINVNRPGWGVETMLNNLDQPELLGGRVFVRPLELANVHTPLLSKLIVGGTYLVDVDPVPDEIDVTLTAIAADLTLPLIDRKLLSLRLYDEIAWLSYPDPNDEIDTVKGNAVGAGLDVSRLHVKLEYRNFDVGFEPTLFDSHYEFRARTRRQGIVLPEIDPESKTTKGYFGAARLDLIEGILASGTFEDYDGTGPTAEPRLGLQVIETDLIEPIDVHAYYKKRAIGSDGDSFFEDLVDLDERSIFIVEIVYKLSGPLQLVATREYRFREREDEEGFEPIKKTTIQIGLAF